MTVSRPDGLLGDDQRTLQVPQAPYPHPGQAPAADGYRQQPTSWDGGYATATPTYPPAPGAQNAAGQWYPNPGIDTSAMGYTNTAAPSPMNPGYPAPAYPGPAQPAPATKRRGLWIVTLVAAVVILAVGAAVIKVTVFSTSNSDSKTTTAAQGDQGSTSTQPSAPTAAPVPASALESLLLSKSEVAQIVGASSMVGTKNSGGEIYTYMGKTKYLDADCIILMPTELANYGGSGYTGTRSQYLDSPTVDRRIEQAVVSFPDAQSAANYVTKAQEKIGKCSNRSANFRKTTDTDDDWWTVGAPQNVDGVITVPHNQEGNEGWSCQTGLTARNNVVVDLYVCGRNIADHVAVTFTKAIADNVDKQK